MTATMREIREGLADSLRTIDGLQVSPYVLSNPTLPAAVITRGPIDYDQAFQGGTHMLTLLVRVYVADLLDIAAATNLDAYLDVEGDASVFAAIEADTTLGGLIQDLHVTDAKGEQVYVRDTGGPMLGSEWTVNTWL